ncbi:hypothetical protein [Streptomyces megasporus]|uniref:hypothetical protein n=1 Tax=Streptomyces megasporus TaxID=44060 RepID=UPI0004E0CA16|nr:hypothetical protein [Streptomyces megasporus]
MLITGTLLMIQGFGSALAVWLGDGNWGLLAWAETWFELPSWTGAAVGGLGLALVLIDRLVKGGKAARTAGRPRRP